MHTIVICGLLFICCVEARFSDPYISYSPIERGCLEELNLDVHKINKAFNIGYIQEGNEDVNKFMECCGRKDGSLTPDGEIDFESMRPSLSRTAYKLYEHPPSANSEKVNEIIENCKNVQGDSPGDLAVKVHNCINRKFVGATAEEIQHYLPKK